MRTQPMKMAWPDPIIGYREFVDGIWRAVFEDSAGQYLMADDGERTYGVYLAPQVETPLSCFLSKS